MCACFSCLLENGTWYSFTFFTLRYNLAIRDNPDIVIVVSRVLLAEAEHRVTVIVTRPGKATALPN